MTDFLDVYPRQGWPFTESGEGFVIVEFVKTETKWFERVFFKKMVGRTIKIELDEVGSFVWKLCDGQTSVRDIIKKSEEHFGERVRPADQRVVIYLKQLEANKLLKFYQKQ